MVENSVRFALDRCKQFLKLATYLRETALEENSDIRKTKKICDHIVKIDTEFFHDKDESRESDSDEDSSEDSSEEVKGVLAHKSLPKDGKKSHRKEAKVIKDIRSIEPDISIDKENQHNSAQCQVKLYPSLSFQGKAWTVSSRVKNIKSHKIRSLRVIGPCTWTFYDDIDFRGHSFQISGNADPKKKEMESVRHGSTRSFKKFHANNAEF